MNMPEFNLVFLGLLYDLGGVIILGLASLLPVNKRKLQKETATVFGTNASTLKLLLQIQYDTRFGSILLISGFAMQVGGYALIEIPRHCFIVTFSLGVCFILLYFTELRKGIINKASQEVLNMNKLTSIVSKHHIILD